MVNPSFGDGGMVMSRKITTEEYISRIEGIWGSEYTVLGEYKSAKDKILVKHNKCGSKYEVSAQNLYRRGCQKCSTKRVTDAQRWTDEEFKRKVYEEVGNEFTFVEKYVDSQTKIKVIHNSCGNAYSVTPRNFLRKGDRCPLCWSKRKGLSLRLSPEVFYERISVFLNGEFTLLNEYETASKYIKVKHLKCGMVFERKPITLTEGIVCPNCMNKSSGEYFVAQWLKENGFEYIQEYTFDDCVHKNKLRFDFAVVDDQKEVKLLIEYNGRQHYEPVEFWGGEDGLEIVKLRDKIKQKYADENDIPLISIRYDEDVDAVLSKLIAR